MTRYIDPLSDFGFKKLFGSEQSKDLLMSFLNDLLILEAPIVDLKFENVEHQGNFKDDRKSIYDIRCLDSNNSTIIIELQRKKQDYFKDRMFYYSSTAISDFGKKGDEWDYQLPKIYSIGIVDFPIFSDFKYLHYGEILDIETHKLLYEKYHMIFIEIKKFDKKSYELNSHLDKWLYFLKNLANDESIYDLFKDDPELHKGLEISEMSKLSKEDYQSYLAEKDEIHKKFAELKSAEEKGVQQGIQQGELQAKLETAKNLLNLNIDINIVMQSTGLTKQQLKENHLI